MLLDLSFEKLIWIVMGSVDFSLVVVVRSATLDLVFLQAQTKTVLGWDSLGYVKGNSALGSETLPIYSSY